MWVGRAGRIYDLHQSLSACTPTVRLASPAATEALAGMTTAAAAWVVRTERSGHILKELAAAKAEAASQKVKGGLQSIRGLADKHYVPNQVHPDQALEWQAQQDEKGCRHSLISQT